MLKPSGSGREDAIVECHESHGARNIRVRLEGEAAVEGEVPEHGEDECEEITEPMLEMKQLFEKSKTGCLNYAG